MTLYKMIDDCVACCGVYPHISGLETLEEISAFLEINHENIPDDAGDIAAELKEMVILYAVPAVDEKSYELVEEYIKFHGLDSFEDLVKLIGLLVDKNLWESLSELLGDGTINKEDVFFCRQDVYDYFIKYNVPSEIARLISEEIRKGKLLHYSEESLDVLRQYDIPEWFIDVCKRTRYLVSRDIAIMRATVIWRLAYFRHHYEEAYSQISVS